jgi:uncharacterized protein (TIGR03435 family)
MEVKHADMTALVNTLPRLVGRPVVDLTGLTGKYDFELEFSREDVSGSVMAGPSVGGAMPATEFGISIFTSIQRIGLRLNAQKLPLDTIVVDRAEKTAPENSARGAEVRGKEEADHSPLRRRDAEKDAEEKQSTFGLGCGQT